MKSIFKFAILFIGLICSSPLYSKADPIDKKGLKQKRSTKHLVHRMKGWKYVVSTQEKQPLFFTKKYSKNGRLAYRTIYQVYDANNKPISLITAVHNKARKTVEVSVKDLQIERFPIVNIESITYDVPFTGRFGSIGKVGAIGKGKSKTEAPSQLTLRFLNKRFDYVKVINIADAHEDTDKNLQVFILDE